MIEQKKSLLQTEETEKVSKKPLSDEELSSLIRLVIIKNLMKQN